MKKYLVLLTILSLSLLLASCGGARDDGLTETEGRLLLASNGTALLVTADGTPITLSVQADGDDPFAGLSTGDKVSVTHDGIQETYPAQTGAYDWKLLEEGSMDDIPEDTLAALEDLGWDFGRDVHVPAAEPQTVEDPLSGYCGNTVTEIILNGETYSFWGSDSVSLTDLLENMNYADDTCRCMPEFTVHTEFGRDYGVNLTEFYVRHGDHQAPLTAEQAQTIQDILDRNCPGDFWAAYPLLETSPLI